MNFGQINNFKVYIAPPFETPVITGSPHLVEWFSDLTAIGNKWIKSSGKKDDAENSVSKYDGKFCLVCLPRNKIFLSLFVFFKSSSF